MVTIPLQAIVMLWGLITLYKDNFMLQTILIFAASLISFNSIASVTSQDLFTAINLRLSYMEDVALYKAYNNEPIEDTKREAIVINNASISAEKEGLNKESVVDFFSAQISAAKAIQYRYRADLLTTSTDKKPKDLETVIRPELIKLGKDINTKIAQYLREGGSFTKDELEVFKATLKSRYLKESDKELLFDSLTKIRLQ
ncbi:chorismate mutase [Vibrio cholerae]|nr:chorismate mutase [Vibrio cholerae]KNA47618.1 chorismate mutase type II [Vibrio cholerae MZO-2]EJL6260975.1 chorismate mutase [Vibrio cholerae]EJL6267643.1 chorismate mutase [Vibrio cholerae]EJL6307528.1 chorismate mutase [Vibrio cholerae]